MVERDTRRAERDTRRAERDKRRDGEGHTEGREGHAEGEKGRRMIESGARDNMPPVTGQLTDPDRVAPGLCRWRVCSRCSHTVHAAATR